jgi:diguanylate cyclase
MKPGEVTGEFLIRRRRLCTIAAAVLAGWASYGSGAGAWLDRALQPLGDAIRQHDASGEVAVVEIDARSIAAIDRWPWPRRVHAAAVDRLNAAGARSIAFDVDFSAASTAAEDGALAAALERAGGKVTLPTFRQYSDSSRSNYIDSVPSKAFESLAFLGAVNVIPDTDGYVRQMPLGVETTGVPRPSLSTMVAERNAQIGRSFDIDYAIDPASVPRFSVVDIISGRVPAAELAGKRFIIGATAIELGDRYAVPGHGVIPGVVIQALAAETLLEGRMPERWGPAPAILLALGLVAIVAGWRKRARYIALGAVALTLPLAALLMKGMAALTVPIASALLAVAGAAVMEAISAYSRHRRELASTDPETGLPNLLALRADGRELGPINLVAAQIDRFTAIASGLGPETTARLVQRTAERIRYANGDRPLYRIDDAHLAWLEPVEEEVGLDGRIEALAALMRSPVECGRLVDVSIACGLASGDGRDAAQLAADASLAAQRAARRGARWERHEGTSDETDWHLSLLGELDAAMAAGQVWNAYQPKLDIASNRIIGVEALVRWLHPDRGPIAPDRFIPVVENAGRIAELTVHVMGMALEDGASWHRQGMKIGVAVNVSAVLLSDHAFIETVRQMLLASDYPNEFLTIEVTESAAMHDPDRAVAALQSWRTLGVGISIDDYGTGQSSLGYLQKLPATELKIDRSFVATVHTDPRNAVMVRSTVALAHELGMKVVAEGIEDDLCLAKLREIGCDIAQGYLIGKPAPADDIADRLLEQQRVAA